MFLRPPASIAMSGRPTVTAVVLTPLKRLTVYVCAFARETGGISASAFAMEARIANSAKEQNCMVMVIRG